MPGRSNALSELTRLWLEERHGCLVRESIPVPVPYALSDIDMLALRLDGQAVELPNGARIGPRLIVETKDEHDWEPMGREFAKLLLSDIALMSDGRFIPAKTKGVKFTMLKEEHFAVASKLFGTDDFDRLFVVHALDNDVRRQVDDSLAERRIYWLTARELVADLERWYRAHPRATALRNTLVGDLVHLLFGYCGMRMPIENAAKERGYASGPP